MNRKELEKHLREIREELNQKVPQYFDEAILIYKLNKEQQVQVTNEFHILDDFDLTFKASFLGFMVNLQRQYAAMKQISNPPKTSVDLFQGSFFHFEDVPKITRHRPLINILEHINRRINDFYRLQKSTIDFLMDQERRLDSTQSSPSIIEIAQTDKKELRSLTQYQLPTDEQLNCPQCVCKKIVITKDKGNVQRCAMCKNYYHMVCLRIEKPKRVFVCPGCILVGIDPMHELQVMILEPTVFESIEGRQNVFTQKFSVKKVLPPDNLVELRCLKIDGVYEDIAWPDLGEVNLNGKRILELRPLAHNSCLKKRKDEKLSLNTEVNNTISIKELGASFELKSYRITQGVPYLLGLFQVRVLKINDFIKKVKNDQTCWLGIEQSKKLIELSILQNQFDEVTMESIKISLDCVFDLNQLQTPARGSICEHIQCFSLENLATMMKQVSPRKWKCPICKSIILGLQIDAYQLCILNVIKQRGMKLNEVSFDQFGEVEDQELKNLIKLQESNLPDYARTNTNRVIPLEQISQRILKISNLIEPKKPEQPKRFGASLQDAILID